MVEAGRDDEPIKTMVLVGRYTCTPYPMILEMRRLDYMRLEEAVCGILQEESERRSER